MSSGYVVLTVIFFVVALLISLAAYYYYTKVSIKKMNVLSIASHVLALYMCVLPFPLLVIDIDAALYARDTNSTSQSWMRPIWITIFAVTYFSAWVTLPLSQMYTESGSFTWRGALLDSLKLNAKLYAVIIVGILVFLTYLLILKGAYTSFASIAKVAVSLANAWGLLILTLFMPAGLIGVPRMFWSNADAKRLLRGLLFEAVEIQEDLDFAAMDLAAMKSELIAIDPLVADADRPHLGRMLELISEADRDIPLYHLAAQRVKAVPSTDRNDVSLKHLEAIHRRLKHSIKVATRANYRWTSMVRRSAQLDQIIRGTKATNNIVKRCWFAVRTYVYWFNFFVCAVLTVLILWSELVLPFRKLTKHPLGVIEYIMNSGLHFVGSIVLLFYMAYCAYWAAFQFRVFDVYVVYPSIADNASLCFNITFLVRLLMPLCFNFLLISGLSDTSTGVDVMYGHVYRRNMDISLLFGEWVNRFLPMLIPFLAVIVLFRLAQRLLALVGIEIKSSTDTSSSEVRQRIADGRRLVSNELGYQIASATLQGEPELPEGQSAVSRAAPADLAGSRDSTSNRPAPGSRYREYLEKRDGTAGRDEDDPSAHV